MEARIQTAMLVASSYFSRRLHKRERYYNNRKIGFTKVEGNVTDTVKTALAMVRNLRKMEPKLTALAKKLSIAKKKKARKKKKGRSR